MNETNQIHEGRTMRFDECRKGSIDGGGYQGYGELRIPKIKREVLTVITSNLYVRFSEPLSTPTGSGGSFYISTVRQPNGHLGHVVC
jgi:hypothetical protein